MVFNKMRRIKSLVMILGLGLSILLFYYVFLTNVNQPRSNRQEFNTNDLNQQLQNSYLRSAKASKLDESRDFNINDIILPASQESTLTKASESPRKNVQQLDPAKSGGQLMLQNKQKLVPANDEKKAFENVTQQKANDKQEKKVTEKDAQQSNNVAKENKLSGNLQQPIKSKGKLSENIDEELGKQDKKVLGKVADKPAEQKNKAGGKIDQQSNIGAQKASEQLSNVNLASETVKLDQKKEKFLIYLCDNKIGCYGLGDRQRAIVATYYLAGLTGRRFGLIMTSPANLREFYEPNIVKWDITRADLPQNASMIEIKAHGGDDLHLDKVDFNTVYPQDIVLMRTNHVFWHQTLKNHVYDTKIPEWARIPKDRLISEGFVRLMKPTPLLRESLNKVLMSIAEKIQEESEVRQILEKTACCKKKTLPSSVPVCAGNRSICASESSTQACCDKLRGIMFAGCPELRQACSDVDFKSCADLLSNSSSRWDKARSQVLAHTFCTMPPSFSKLNGTIDSIRKKKGFDLTDLNLMCAHIRMGHSKTFSFEHFVFNKPSHIHGIWDFLKTFARKGYHLYLASDAQEVKDEAKTIFGTRLHMMENKIVHIDHERKIQADEAKAGLMFTLTEQLLLATSCREMVRSHSGYSGRAAEIRSKLMNYAKNHVYRFHDGIVE